MQQHRRGDRGSGRDPPGGGFGRGAAAAGQALVFGDQLFEDVAVDGGIEDLHRLVEVHAQAHVLDLGGDHVAAAEQDGAGDVVVDQGLRGAQDAFVLAFREDDALGVAAGGFEHRAHQVAGAEDEAFEVALIGLEIGDRPPGDAAFDGGAGDRGGDFQDQARVERFRDDVVGTEHRGGAAIGRGDDLTGFDAGELGDGFDGGDLHRLIDRGGPDVQRAAEDERKAQDVVDLVGIVAAAGGDDGVRAGGGDEVGVDFRVGVGQRQDQRLVGQQRQPFGFQHPRGGQAHEDVAARQRVLQRGGVGVAGVAGHVGQHVGAVFGDDALDVRQRDVFRPQTHGDQQIDAGQGRRAGAGGDQLDVRKVLALQQQAVADGGGDGDGGAVLVVMEHRDPHAGSEFGLDGEALGGLDVFQVDRAEGGFQGGDDVAEFGRVGGVDLDIEHVDAGEFLEQDGLALHHRLAGERADVAQAEHGGAVGDHGDQIAAHGIIVRRVRFGLDRLAGGGDAGGVGQGQIALRRHALGRLDGEFPWPGKPVVVERGLAEIVVHRCLGVVGLKGRTMVGGGRAGNMGLNFSSCRPSREWLATADGRIGNII